MAKSKTADTKAKARRLISISKLKTSSKDLKATIKEQESIILRQDEEITAILSMKEQINKVTTQVDLSSLLPSVARTGIVTAFLSDIHGEEVIDPRKIQGLNKYNPAIATQRIRKFFYLTLKKFKRIQKELDVKELHLMLGGDNITNNIHQELSATNALNPMHALLFIESELIRGIRYLSENIGDVTLRVLCVTGNHPRITVKITHKTRTGNNLEYYMYKTIEQYFTSTMTGYDNVKFEVAEGAFIKVITPYGLTYTLSHGDHFRYQGGIGGLMIPAMRWHLQFSKAVPADKRYIGNWHNWIPQNDITLNGSIIGYSEYAMGLGLPFQPPIQHMEVIDSIYGFTEKIPLDLR